MTAFFSTLIGALTLLLLVAMKSRFIGFRSQSPADFQNLGPQFDLRHHLSGEIQCEGVIYGPFGRVSSRFVAEMHGSWSGNKGMLKETFYYDNGEVQKRCWNLSIANDGKVEATAADIVGTGLGTSSGPSVQMRYRIRLDPSSGGHVLDVTDWMYLLGNGTIINRSQFTKFGITVAELVATMRRVPA